MHKIQQEKVFIRPVLCFITDYFHFQTYIQDLERGQLNVLVKCSANAAAEEDDRREKVIIRVFGDVLPFHRDSEVHLMRLLSEKGIIPPVYCRYRYCSWFVQSMTYLPWMSVTKWETSVSIIDSVKCLAAFAVTDGSVHGRGTKSCL